MTKTEAVGIRTEEITRVTGLNNPIRDQEIRIQTAIEILAVETEEIARETIKGSQVILWSINSKFLIPDKNCKLNGNYEKYCFVT